MRFAIVAAFTSILALGGCGPSLPPSYIPEESIEIYSISQRQLPPAPVYNRIAWTYPPVVIPDRDVEFSSPRLNPVFQLNLKNVTLEDAAKKLAKNLNYRSYAVSSVAHQRITLNRAGTMDELGEAIAETAGIRVVVDHDNHEVRFLTQVTETIDFADPKSGKK